MEQVEIARRNLDLLNEFMQYAFEHPGVLDQIPSGAEMVILPENDPELAAENTRTVRALEEKGSPVVVVKLRRREPIPEPKIEVKVG
jgi:hypothetical protein